MLSDLFLGNTTPDHSSATKPRSDLEREATNPAILKRQSLRAELILQNLQRRTRVPGILRRLRVPGQRGHLVILLSIFCQCHDFLLCIAVFDSLVFLRIIRHESLVRLFTILYGLAARFCFFCRVLGLLWQRPSGSEVLGKSARVLQERISQGCGLDSGMQGCTGLASKGWGFQFFGSGFRIALVFCLCGCSVWDFGRRSSEASV